MSKSYRKTKAIKLCGSRSSDKKDRTLANKLFRKYSKQTLNKEISLDEEQVYPKLREVSDVYSFNSDGLAYYDKDLPEKYMRK